MTVNSGVSVIKLLKQISHISGKIVKRALDHFTIFKNTKMDMGYIAIYDNKIGNVLSRLHLISLGHENILVPLSFRNRTAYFEMVIEF